MDGPVLNPGVVRRNRRHRWEAKGLARVTHPNYGTVVVPCASPFAALKCAAEVWRCKWVVISKDATVTAAMSHDIVAVPPFRTHKT